MTPLKSIVPPDNGARLHVETDLYTGIAGVMPTAHGGEFAAPGDLPFGQQAISGKVDGRLVRITGVRASASNKQMIVVRFAWAEEVA